MKNLILEGRVLKRLSKKVKMRYVPLAPGESWTPPFGGQRVAIIADKDNTGNVYIGWKN